MRQQKPWNDRPCHLRRGPPANGAARCVPNTLGNVRPDGVSSPLTGHSHFAKPILHRANPLSREYRPPPGVDDIRGIMGWLDEELASRSVNDRLGEMKRHLGERFPKYSEHSERLRLLEDRDGDGKADHSTVFADAFNTPLDGIGAG